jgi:hypothetical protein
MTSLLTNFIDFMNNLCIIQEDGKTILENNNFKNFIKIQDVTVDLIR